LKTWVILGALAALLCACAAPSIGLGPTPTPTCEAGLPAFGKVLDPLAREWDDANALANSTPRNSLPGQIANLQSVRRHVQDIVAPDCGAVMKQHLVSAMDATIEGYIAFLTQKPDADVSAHFATAGVEMKAYQAAIIGLVALPTATP
jgi:hypothetical protein